jgi:AraC family L-rhamnose operon regulatory protein RhaS
MLTITRPWQPHRVGNPHVGPSRLHWLIIDVGVRRPNQPWHWPSWFVLAPEDLKRITKVLRHNEHAVWTADQEICQCWQRIGRAVEADVHGSSHSRLRVQINELFVLIGELLARIEPQLDPTLTSSERTVELFLAELRHNPEQRSRQWTLAEMAKRCGLSVTHFVNTCQRLTNRAPVHYLTRCRIEAARESLAKDTHASITDVALACGFSSSQYFATVFRRELGTTPVAFRNRRENA